MKTKEKNKTNEKGITLIALIITIIVLLILAGVTIAILTGDNGLITNTNDANIKNIEGRVKEQIKLAVNSAKLYTEKKAIDGSYIAQYNLEDISKIMGKDLNGNENLISTKNKYQLVYSTPEEGTITITYGKAGTDGDKESIKGGNDDYAKACNDKNAVIVSVIKVTNNTFEIVSTTVSKRKTSADQEEEEESKQWKLGDSDFSGNITVGDLIIPIDENLDNERFYVIAINGKTLTLLANRCIDTSSNKQVNTGYSTVIFDSSTTVYANSSIRGLVKNYVDNLNLKGFNLEDVEEAYGGSAVSGRKGRLMWKEEISSLASDILYGPSDFEMNYWLGTKKSNTNVWYIFGEDNYETYTTKDDDGYIGVRPVIKILDSKVLIHED